MPEGPRSTSQHALIIFSCATIICNFVNSSDSKLLPNVTYSGYLDVNKHDGSRIFYSYYEAQEPHKHAPILLWLQVI